MDAKLKADWVKALRSGEFEQTRRELANDACSAFCCIGAGYQACIGNVYDLGEGNLERTEAASLALGLTAYQQKRLVEMNDLQMKTFPQIADYIERNL